MKAFINVRILTDDGWRDDAALLLKGAVIADICPLSDIADDIPSENLNGQMLVPGFIDVQVNGGGGLLINDAPEVATLETVAEAHRKFGTTSLLPTLITDDWATKVKMAKAAAAAIKSDMPGIKGVHFEGPYLNKERKGVHNEAHIRAFEDEFIDLVGRGNLGIVVVTLAPEKAGIEVIKRLVDSGVKVCAGHSNASYAETQAALEAGLSGFTHLYNAMPPFLSREPGIVGAALENKSSYAGIINDGFHVHPATLKSAIAAKGADHMMLVTDAMPPVGTGMTEFQLGDQLVKVREGRCETSGGTLAGSNLDMATAVRNTVSLLGQSLENALKMASATPAAFLSIDDQYGKLAAGYVGDMVLLDNDLTVQKTWISGLSSD